MKKIKVVIEKDGSFSAEALEGFVGQQCHTELQNLVSVMGASVTEAKNKPEFYDDDGVPEFLTHDA